MAYVTNLPYSGSKVFHLNFPTLFHEIFLHRKRKVVVKLRVSLSKTLRDINEGPQLNPTPSVGRRLLNQIIRQNHLISLDYLTLGRTKNKQTIPYCTTCGRL